MSPRTRSYSHIRRIGSPSAPVIAAAYSGAAVSGQCPRMPMFHSAPPENHASRRARFAGCRIALR